MTDFEILDFIVVGGGPAGCSACIYLGMSGYRGILIDINESLLVTSDNVENYPGFPDINGYDLSLKFLEHAKRHVDRILPEYVKDINPVYMNNKLQFFEVKTDKSNIKAKTVVIASGAKHKKLGIDKELELANEGIFYCALCDGYRLKDKKVAVVGGGNSAFESAIYLSTICSKVFLIHRSEKFRAFQKNQDLLNREVRNGKVEILTNANIIELIGNKKLTEIKIKKDREIFSINLDGVFINIGQEPNTNFINGIKKIDGFIYVNEDFSTSISGIFACGDCITSNNIRYRQAVVAASEGCISAMSSVDFLKKL